MNYNLPSDIVKNLSFNEEAREKILSGVNKLSDAVETTLGASGLCVIYEDSLGNPVITKDGVTVADSIVLEDPIENMGANLIKQAARNTVKEVGDSTTTSVTLSRYLIKALSESDATPRELREGVMNGVKKVNEYLDNVKVDVDNNKLISVATISANNDNELGGIIADSFIKVGKNGVVLIEESDTGETYNEIVDGVSFDSGLTSPFFVTEKDRKVSELKNPLVLLSMSPIQSVRKIYNILEHCSENGRPLLIIAEVDQSVLKPIIANKVKGNLKVNVVAPAGFGNTKHDTMEDLAILTNAKLFSEEMGDDMDLMSVDDLGEAILSVTDDRGTTLTIENVDEDKIKERVISLEKLISEEKNGFTKGKLEQRLAMLSGKVGIVYVGGNSEVEMKERKDRVDDAVHATKSALIGGIVSGGGVALRDASSVLDLEDKGEAALHYAINMPIKVIAKNANINKEYEPKKGFGLDAVSGDVVNMVESNIIDPYLVVKTSLKNAVSVATTIVSANCVISNMRDYAGNR